MQRNMRGLLAVAAATLLVAAACGGQAPGGGAPPAQKTPRLGGIDRPIVLAFVPSQDVARVTASGNAIKASLERATGLAWKVSVPTSYAATVEGMCAGQIDIAFLAPLSFVLANDKGCADVMLMSVRNDPLTGQPSTTYSSQILVRTDSGINDIAGLKGKRFAFVDPISASGTLYPTLLIKQKGGQDPKTFFSQTIFAGGHDRAVIALYQGSVDGAASFIDVRDSLEKQAAFKDIKQKTKRIDTAGPIPNDTVSARRGFPEDLKKQVTNALLEYAKTDAGKSALRSLYSIDGLQTGENTFYDGVREAAKLAGLDLETEAKVTPRPVATPTPPRSP